MDKFSDDRKIFAPAQKEIVWSKVDDPNSWNVPEHPVAWATIKNGYPTAWLWNPEYVKTNPNMSIELYAAPPKRDWVGLTDEEWYKIWDDANTDMNYQNGREDAQRMIEAALKFKNGF